MSEFDLVQILRAMLVAARGFIIGRESERRGAFAGDRTYALVALGAAACTS